ncbi:MAG: hypothetical protein HOV81_15035 [Kofleriaceae bacterium]|nr:hypothetical protein [Kofleriaceae bacterium]
MVDVHIEADQVRVKVLGMHRLWALKRELTFPRAAVRAVRRLPPDALKGWWKGLRAPGTSIPGVIAAGTFHKDGERHFWDVRHANRAIEIDLEGETYAKLFVEVEDPEAAVRMLEP